MQLNESIVWQHGANRVVLSVAPSPIYLVEAEGLDGLEQEIYSTKGSGQAGISVSGASPNEREIVIRFQLRRPSRQTARRQLLRAFQPSAEPGTLTFVRGSERWNIQCYVEAAPRFTDGVMPQGEVTLIAPAPAMLAPESSVDIARWVDNIQFDFEIPEEGHELTSRAPQLIVNAHNAGDMEAGAIITIRATGEAENPSLLNVMTREQMSFTISMEANDVLTVCTAYGKKRVMFLRDGVESNAFAALNAGSTWMQIHPGDNFLRYAAELNEDNLEVSVRFASAFSGV